MTPRKTRARPRVAVERIQPLRFPFPAVVGQEEVKLALLLNAVDPAIGGVLLRGQKGSAKSTLARALAGLLPGGAPFVDLPVGATEDRVVGSFDLRAAVSEGVQRYTPGLLATAHGGVLYVDEVNLLPDHLVDVLLDVAASGVNRVERDGISHEHPSRFVLVGSMNPEEGDLRPQLLDRFGLAVEVIASADPAERAEAVARRLAFDADPVGFLAEWEVEESRLRARLGEVAGTMRGAPALGAVPDEVRAAVSVLCAHMGVEGLRADIVICRAAGALAVWEERDIASLEDVARVAPLALSHRRRRSPLERQGVDPDELARALEAAEGLAGPRRPASPRGENGPGSGPARSDGSKRSARSPGGSHRSPGVPASSRSEGDEDTVATPHPPGPVDGVLGNGQGFAIRRAGTAATGARRSRAMVEAGQGRVIGARVPNGAPASVAVHATVMAAASRATGGGSLAVAESDIREKVRRRQQQRLVIFVVDTSGSIAVGMRIAAVKRVVAGILLAAYSSRDQVALVAFRGEGAELALSPTGSIEVAGHRLDALATGGSTPLAAGLVRGLEVAQRASTEGHRPLMVVVTDGRATWSEGGTDPFAAAVEAAGRVGEMGVDSVVVDAEQGAVRLGLAKQLAQVMGARYARLDELEATSLDP